MVGFEIFKKIDHKKVGWGGEGGGNFSYWGYKVEVGGLTKKRIEPGPTSPPLPPIWAVPIRMVFL